MADFEQAFKKVLSFEQGYVNDPVDRGGETKYGISKRRYPALDIEALTLDEAKGIYKRDYWDELSLGRMRNQTVAEEVFDTAVNMGCRTAGAFLQEALRHLTGSDLVVDGVIGERTIDAVNAYPYTTAILKTLNGLQFCRYLRIVERDPSQRKFFRGWLKRVEYREERT